MVSKPINPFHWSFLQVIGLVVLVFFNLIEWKLCFIGIIAADYGPENHHKEVDQA
jgi:hypothetical protein